MESCCTAVCYRELHCIHKTENWFIQVPHTPQKAQRVQRAQSAQPAGDKQREYYALALVTDGGLSTGPTDAQDSLCLVGGYALSREEEQLTWGIEPQQRLNSAF